jgi:hypothetical protein
MESEVAARVMGPIATGTMARIPGVEGVTVGGTAVGMEVTVARGADVGSGCVGCTTVGVEAAVAPHPDTRRGKITRIVNIWASAFIFDSFQFEGLCSIYRKQADI